MYRNNTAQCVKGLQTINSIGSSGAQVSQSMQNNVTLVRGHNFSYVLKMCRHQLYLGPKNVTLGVREAPFI